MYCTVHRVHCDWDLINVLILAGAKKIYCTLLVQKIVKQKLILVSFMKKCCIEWVRHEEQGGHGREQGGHGRGRLLGKDDSSLHALVISDRTVHYTVR